ncbi:MAG TPA: immunoglobulin-like domain-containing protein [Candidatus Acidoferrum sp.]|nr:immunoglobulin-like domain-containing protein [Candidatus Acidoferrum sp.]
MLLAICSLGLLPGAHAQVIANLDLGNNALASNGAGFTKLGTSSGYAAKNGSFCLWTNVANSGLNLAMTNIAEYGGAGLLDADGFYNVSGNGPAYFTISNAPPGQPVTLYTCWAWNGASHAPIIFYGGTQITVTNNGEMTNPNLLTLQNVGTATAGADGTVSGYWYGDQGGTPVGHQEGQIGALIINVGPCRPVITLNGANPMGIHLNSAFTDPGATALETCGNAVVLTTNGTVNPAALGAYTLTYTAVASADNATNIVTRTVNVWNSDVLNLDPAKSGDGISTPAGFNRLNYANSNPLTFQVLSVNGATYTVGFTNLSGTYNTSKYNTLDQDGFYVNNGVTAGFYVSGLYPGDVVTLYACWAWDGAGNPGVITFGGTNKTLNVGSDITSPSTNTFMLIGSAAVDATGTVRGTWTGLAGKQGQIGGMIFTVAPPGSFNVAPGSLTNNCPGAATFSATAALGATNFQWYGPSWLPIAGATNTTLVLTSTHPADSGTYTIVESGPNWAATNSAVLLTTDTAPPLITLNGSNTVQLIIGSTYTELGANALDTCAGSSLPVIINGSVNTAVAGEYDITYSAVTGAGTPGSATRAVDVVDPTLRNLVITPPSVAPQCGSNVTFTSSVNGLPPITYQWYDNQTNAIPGATNASFILVAPEDVSIGTYTLIAQNAYSSLTNIATVTSALHTAPPVMALNGISPVTLTLNSPYLDAGATAYDLCAQASLSVTSNSTVNTSVAGTYTVTYSAITADGTPGTLTRTVYVTSTPSFGPNVLIFDPGTTNIQSQMNAVFAQQQYNQFGTQRYTYLFKPGRYTNLDIALGFYTQVLGLGQMPDDVTISGNLHSDGVLPNDNATINFWRAAENLSVVPTNGNYIILAVSQGTDLRRLHVQGNVDLADFTDGNWSSGGFLADSKIDATISSISQQQWLSRNDIWGSWSGEVWNMVFVGVSNPPAGAWPANVYTTVTNTPLIREKPFLCLDTNGNYTVMVPALQTNTIGTTWAAGPTPGTSIPISQFYVARADTDTADTMNAALNAGLNLILTPGIYQLTSPLTVTRPDTVILGLGYATLVPQTGTPAMVVSDVDGVKVAGLIFDAGPVMSPALLQVGTTTSALDHSQDPICLYDISMRVGGATAGTTASCLQINANDVIGDNLWLWRADHGTGVGWTQNASNNGLIVNGDRVTIYGLFVEHHEQYETLWNGNWGRLYFYQSELPYDPPSQAAWSHDGVNGYASYKVADGVTSHQAYGIGIYAVFIDSTNINCFNAIETPTNAPQVNVHDMITVYIGGNTDGNGTTAINHIINGTGPAVSGPGYGGTATANCLWVMPSFTAGASASGASASVTFPTESWHAYQLQYKNALSDPGWLNLGAAIGGNDALQTIIDPAPATNRFYRVREF